ncbi:hypothetical protein Pmani_006418 [Petrolisthes manimaculis]|uniref:Uncharacterized protein n=1 Tax=Petrolisthes manimaculis TaxID=1843537 RepID=A0AAE1QCM6_9EUCA|nr:hypothetical protein Pmani_006418 [Petrolisthes manimaculis]
MKKMKILSKGGKDEKKSMKRKINKEKKKAARRDKKYVRTDRKNGKKRRKNKEQLKPQQKADTGEENLTGERKVKTNLNGNRRKTNKIQRRKHTMRKTKGMYEKNTKSDSSPSPRKPSRKKKSKDKLVSLLINRVSVVQYMDTCQWLICAPTQARRPAQFSHD